jgi:hypothetical protein
MNLQRVLGLIPGYAVLTEADRSDVSEKIQALQARIDSQPKTLAWRLRARIGDRVQ